MEYQTTVGIRLTDVSGNRMAISSPVTEWLLDIYGPLLDNYGPYEPFDYRTFRPITEWSEHVNVITQPSHSVTGLIKVR